MLSIGSACLRPSPSHDLDALANISLSRWRDGSARGFEVARDHIGQPKFRAHIEEELLSGARAWFY